MPQFGGYFISAMIDTAGRLVKNATFGVYELDGTTPVSVFSDRELTQSTTARTNSRGNLAFFARPGDVLLQYGSGAPMRVALAPDPRDIYTKPENGIPLEHLASAVREAIGTASVLVLDDDGRLTYGVLPEDVETVEGAQAKADAAQEAAAGDATAKADAAQEAAAEDASEKVEAARAATTDAHGIEDFTKVVQLDGSDKVPADQLPPLVTSLNGDTGDIEIDIDSKLEARSYETRPGSFEDNTVNIVEDELPGGIEAGREPGMFLAGDDPVVELAEGAVQRGERRVSVKEPRFGAQGDGRRVGSGSISAGTTSLTIGSAQFTSDAGGKRIVVWAAGTGGRPLVTTISSVVSSTQVQLAVSASTTATGVEVWWGTDDTAALKAAFASGEDLYLPRGFYLVDCMSDGGGPTSVPLVSPTDGHNVTGAGRRITRVGLIPNPAVSSLRVMTFFGGTVSGIQFDCGFTPEFGDHDLLSAIVIGNRGTMRDCHVRNAQGSCVFGTSGATIESNRLENFGDHAVYVSKDPIAGGVAESDIWITNNTVIENVAYHNNAAHGINRGAIKVRDNVDGVHINGNSIVGIAAILVHGNSGLAEGVPRNIWIEDNKMVVSHTGIGVSSIDVTADNGFRLEDVTAIGNQIAATGTGMWVALNRSAIKASRNTFVGGTNTAGFTRWGSNDDAPPSDVQNNTFKGGNLGVYGLGTGSLVINNSFTGIIQHAAYAARHNEIERNSFDQCGTGLYVAHAAAAAGMYGYYNRNTFKRCTSPAVFTASARSYTFEFNTFRDNTNSPQVGHASSFNNSQTRGNVVLSGAGLPTADQSAAALVWGGDSAATTAELPSAVVGMRGRLVQRRPGGAVPDSDWICRRMGDGAYVWVPLHTQPVGGTRPNASHVGVGAQFFDTSLNKPIWSTGSAWVDASGATV